MTKLQRLRDNIAAIEFVMTQEGRNSNITDKYTGFGGLGFVLNPLDKAAWTKSDIDCYEDTVRLHNLLRENSSSEKEYDRLVQSLKASVLTAYYTPKELVDAIIGAIYGEEKHHGSISYSTHKKGWIKPKVFLDPAAGMGVFMRAVCRQNIAMTQFDYKMKAYEKDVLTGWLLERQFDDETFVDIEGFETIPAEEMGRYDLVATNVPFGDIAVFDPEYSRSKSQVRREAAKMIHRYYVLKGLDCLRDGGIEAYIITSNYLNRDGEQLAEALKQARLIGAYRLANNLFKEAGTEVGTDLLVLQKDSRKQGLTAEESWLLTQYEDSGCPTNMYFDMKPEHVIATDWTVDTDAYGKRALVYHHRDGVAGISKQMGEVLSKDLAANFDGELFRSEKLRVKNLLPPRRKAAMQSPGKRRSRASRRAARSDC